MKNKGACTCSKHHTLKSRALIPGAAEHCTFHPYERRVQTRTISLYFHLIKHIDMIIRNEPWYERRSDGLIVTFVEKVVPSWERRNNSGIALRYHKENMQSHISVISYFCNIINHKAKLCIILTACAISIHIIFYAHYGKWDRNLTGF